MKKWTKEMLSRINIFIYNNIYLFFYANMTNKKGVFNKKKMNRTSKILIWIFSLFALCDIVTTAIVFYGKNGSGLETNPLFIFTGSFTILVALNLFYALFLAGQLNKHYQNPNIVFLNTSVVVQIAFIRTIAIYRAINWMLKPKEIVMQVAQSTSSYEKIISYFSLMFLGYVVPVILSYIIYFIFKQNFKITSK